jgi:ABC-2 type transport system ATP-binding protein
MPPLLSISGFRKKYPSGFEFTLDQLQLQQGVHLIQGGNGSGKSTFLKALAGIHPAEGEIILQGISLRKDPLAYRMQIGYAEAEPVFREFLNADDLIQVVAQAKKAEKSQIEILTEKLGIHKFSSYPVGTYSSGMLKKTAILLAFLGSPSLVILDEPFTTIDVAALPFRDGALEPIFDRRFALHGLAISTRDAFTEPAVTALETVYHDGSRHDYRQVLRVAQRSCALARRRGAEKVDGPDVKRVLAGL